MWDDWDKKQIKRNTQKWIVIENRVSNQRKKVTSLIIITELINQVIFWIKFIKNFRKNENIDNFVLDWVIKTQSYIEYFGWYTDMYTRIIPGNLTTSLEILTPIFIQGK